MNRMEIQKRVRSYARDFNNATFREEDIINYINEGIERVQQIIPEFEGMKYLALGTDVPTHLPPKFHHLLALYGASRCFNQDERFFQAGNMMNEFEIKLDELLMSMRNGEITIYDENGEPLDLVEMANVEYVITNNYYRPIRHKEANKGLNIFHDVDEGVEGV